MKTLPVAWCTSMALALGAGGCGGGEDDSSAQDRPASGAATEASPDRLPARVEVSMRNIAFEPASVTVPKDGTVIWTNDESVGHDVTKTGGPGPAFNSGVAAGMAAGDTFKQTFKAAGTVSYVCRAHLGMEGTVTVK